MGEAASPESSVCVACSARICISGSGLGSAAVGTESLFVEVGEGAEELRLVFWGGTRGQ